MLALAVGGFIQLLDGRFGGAGANIRSTDHSRTGKRLRASAGAWMRIINAMIRMVWTERFLTSRGWAWITDQPISPS